MSTEDRILDAAARIFKEVGFRETTTRRVASEAGVNEVTVFRHFGSKEQLLMRAVQRTLARAPLPALPQHPAQPAAELEAWSLAHARRLYQLRHLLAAGLAERAHYPDACAHTGEAHARVYVELVGWLCQLQARGLASPGFEPGMAAAMLMGALFSSAVGADFAPKGSPASPEDAVRHYLPLFLRAIGVER